MWKTFLNLFLQNVSFTEDTGDAMSFDECLQLLAETFPVEEAEVRTLNHYHTCDNTACSLTCLLAERKLPYSFLLYRTLHFAWTQSLFLHPWCPPSSQLLHPPLSPLHHHHQHHLSRSYHQIWSRPGWSFGPSLSCRYYMWTVTPQWHSGLRWYLLEQIPKECISVRSQALKGQTPFCLLYESGVSYMWGRYTRLILCPSFIVETFSES